MAKCKECRHWDIETTKIQEGQEIYSYCKRYAPVVDSGLNGGRAVWPLVSSITHACGEFKKK